MGTPHTEVKLWTKLKPAYSRNAGERKYFPSVYITGMFPPLLGRLILLQWQFSSARMENLASFRCLKLLQIRDRAALQFIKEQGTC